MAKISAKPRPDSWQVLRNRVKNPWVVPFIAFEWMWEWLAFLLSNWSFLHVVEYLGKFSVLVAVIYYYSETGNRVRLRHYQAWQVINTAQGKSGSGGRMEALQELNADNVSLVGVDVSSAYLRGLKLEGADLIRADFSATDLRGSNLNNVNFSDADLHFANFREGLLKGAVFEGADMSDTVLAGSDLTGAKFDSVNLENADMNSANLQDIQWKHISKIKLANIAGVRNAPEGFVAWALKNGAVQTAPEEQ